ncbi:hypothetical protein [Streptomyces acidicola]|uniref:hypothetical protein n=1 Tax=Streptomyces acidicola TaxID=2596892 RepID=UPI003427FA31
MRRSTPFSRPTTTTPRTPLCVVSTNHFVGGDQRHAVLTAYIYGVTPQEPTDADPPPAQAAFGATLGADLPHPGSRLALRGTADDDPGESDGFAKWCVPSPEDWRIGDPTPTIVSEPNSPWALGLEHSPPCEAA